jgi:hypothetical protein
LLLASGSDDKTIHLWGVSDGSLLLSNAARMFTTCSRQMFTSDVRPVFTTHFCKGVAYTTGRKIEESTG